MIRLQFWALEIARNREGYNDCLRKQYQASQALELDANIE